MNPETLFCRICKVDLPFDDFSPYQQKDRYPKCKKCVSRKSCEWAKRNPEKANAKSAKHRKKVGKKAYNKRISAFQRKRWPELRNIVLSHYGKQCACCGESIIQFLQIDHMNNDGGKHRASGISSGSTFYYWLIRNDFPEGFQTLCVNCNWGKVHNNGICPHKELQ